MNTQFFSLLIVAIAIALVATTIAAVIKLVLFFRQKDTYRHIVIFGLLGEVLGFLIVFIALRFYSNQIENGVNPDDLIAIPFYLMLLGLVVGTLKSFKIVYMRKK